MPTYVYRCNDCDYTFEVRQHMSDEPLTECPSCKEGTVRRVINSVGVVFKGSGFYVTDNRKNGKNGSSSSTTTTASSSESADKGAVTSTEKSEKPKTEKAGEKK